ncbi:MAG: hypothetical protein EOO01_15075 [Chitinophagaceae bacterium]|nr:MAG: hypothetical protein EOO01_15075 [Chitinophagaceae bacterium]
MSRDTLLFPSATNALWKAILAWGLITLTLTVLVFFVNKWLLDKLYGNHIRKLRLILSEMSGE